MLSSVRNMIRVPDLRNKILFTLLMIALYRLGAYIPAPGIDLDAVEELKDRRRPAAASSASCSCSRAGAHPVRAVRPRDHAVHHQLDHHADPRGGDPQAGGVAAAGGRRAAQDHPVDALPGRRHRAAAVHRPGVPLPQRWRRSARRSGQQHRPRPGARVHAVPGDHRGDHPDGRARPADVDGGAHHPAGHRQRHVAADLRLGREQLPGSRGTAQRREGHAAPAGTAGAGRDPAGGHRVHRAGPAAHPGAVRQAGRRAVACTAARAPTSR